MVEATQIGATLDEFGVGVWAWDRRSGTLELNPSAERLLGMADGHEHIDWESCSERLHPDDRGRVQATFERAITEKRPTFLIQYRCVWPDGSIHWLDCRAQVTVEDDDAVGFQGLLLHLDRDVGELGPSIPTGVLDAVAQRSAARAIQIEAITAGLAGAASRDEVARIVVDSLIPAVEAQTGSLFLVDEKTRSLHALAIRGYTKRSTLERAQVLPLDRTNALSEAIHTRSAVVIHGVDKFQRRFPVLASELDLSEFPGTSIQLPLIVDGRPIGTLGIGYRQPRPVSKEDLRHLTIIASICAQALGRAMAFEASETARKRLRAVDQISDAALSRLSLSDLLDELPGRIASAIGCDAVRIFIMDDEGKYLEVRGHHGTPEDLLTRVPVGRGLAGTIASTGVPRVIEDISKVEVVTPAFPENVVSEAGVPLQHKGEVIGVLDVGTGPDRPLTTNDLEILELAADRIATALDRGRTFEIERTARRHSELMARLAATVNRPGRLPTQVDEMTELIHHAVAQFCGALIHLDSGEPLISYSALEPSVPESLKVVLPELWDLQSRSDRGYRGLRMLTKDAERRDGTEDPALHQLLRGLNLESLVVIPLRGVVSTVGMLVLGRHDRPFDPAELLLIDDYAARMGTAVEWRLDFDRHRTTAMTLQRSLLPARLPAIPAFDVDARYWPPSENLEVGGDFYDVIPVGEDRWALIVGDISGKGLPASAMTGVARHTARAAARHGLPPSEVLRWIHEAFHEQIEVTEVFCTAIFGVIEKASSGYLFRFAVGGHPLPIHRPRSGKSRYVGTPGTALGLVPNVVFTETAVHLDGGDWLVIYTDGVTDVPTTDAISEEELLEIVDRVSERNCSSAIEGFDLILKERYGNVNNRDDTAMLVIRCTSDDPAPKGINDYVE